MGEQPTSVVADDLIDSEGPRDLYASSATREVGYHFHAVPRLRRYSVINVVHLRRQAFVTSINDYYIMNYI